MNELFLTAVERHNKPDCFLSKSGGRYQGMPSGEALQEVAALALGLSRLGVDSGDRVAILSENRVEWALTDYAILGLGAITVPVYPTLLEPEVEFILRDSGAKGIVVSTDIQLQKVLSVRPRLPELGFVVAMDGSAEQDNGTRGWKQLVETGRKEDAAAVDFFRGKAVAVRPENIASLLYTSGTTGQPKGVILTHANIVSNIRACLDLFPLGADDVAMSFLPLSHIFERTLDYVSLWQGVSIAYAESYDALPQNLREVRPTIMPVVPRILEKVRERVMELVRQATPGRRKLFFWAVEVGKHFYPFRLENRTPPLVVRLKYGLAEALVFSKIRAQLGARLKVLLSGAAPLSRDLAEFFFAVGLPVYEGYGLTETSPVISVNRAGSVKLGTVGRVIPGVEVKLGEEVETENGTVGREILVRGPNVTPGYYHLEAENQKAFVDGWFKTGDLGVLDSEGFLTITGRKKNLFKTSAGKYVSPDKLENLFQGHPYVFQIMVVGEARKFVGAVIVPNFGRLEAYTAGRGIAFKNREELVSHPEIRSFMQQQVDEATRWLSPHEKIRQIVLLPRELATSSGELSATLKIKRRVVEERYRDLIEEMFRRPAPQSESAPAVKP